MTPSSSSSSSSLPTVAAVAETPLPARYGLAQSILGKDAFQRINTSKVLVVGAGGIGCELLKNLVLTGFGNIDIIDLDTIDLSNLNRQFLFQKQHIKKPKSIVAKQTASSFNPLVNIVAHHANIKEAKFDVAYFHQFDLVMNALDNLDARRWVNKMCIAADVPLIESGTTGFLGQVQPIKKGVTECYDCTEKPTPKTFPVCTIRSTPSTPIHCIVWAKSWLFTQLFGADDETEDAELDKAVADGEDASEIDNLRKEAREMRDIRSKLITAAAKPDQTAINSIAKRIFEKIYTHDIQRLLAMEEMWMHRPVKPVPLVFDDAHRSTSSQHESVTTSNGVLSNGSAADPQKAHTDAANASQLKDQRTLSLQENVALFISSLSQLAVRAAAASAPLAFDKDDEDALDLVTASSNLRSFVYQIERKTRFEVKQMAGNIIPAIASTNAIIAGMLVLQALHVLAGRWDQTRFVSLSRGSQRMLTSWVPARPNPACAVCQDVYVPVEVSSFERVTLAQVVERVARDAADMRDVDLVVYDGTRILADPDFEDNLAQPLAALGLRHGAFLTITDEEQALQPVQILLALAPSAQDVSADAAVKILLDHVPAPQPRVAPQPAPPSDDEDEVVPVPAATTPPPSAASRKRPLNTPDHPFAQETPPKKQRLSATGADATSAIELE